MFSGGDKSYVKRRNKSRALALDSHCPAGYAKSHSLIRQGNQNKELAMKINQLSLFLENKPGRLSSPCRALADAGINILTLSLADTQQFGILRLIVRDWAKAQEVLKKAGCVVNVTEVVAIEVNDRPGGLAEVLEIIEKAKLNIEYMYAFTFRREDRAVIVFRFDNPDLAIKTLTAKGINVIGSVELYSRAEK